MLHEDNEPSTQLEGTTIALYSSKNGPFKGRNSRNSNTSGNHSGGNRNVSNTTGSTTNRGQPKGSILTPPPVGADLVSFPSPSSSPPIPMLPSLPPSPPPVTPIPHIPHLPISDNVSSPTASIQQQSTPLRSDTSKPAEPEISERSTYIAPLQPPPNHTMVT
ncbi:hypothetical protein MRB53_025035 [Persea americana]|uniref:Uncharacterized protein n=1 Tax=Persea americana TaxID=3435 RepID=A0ACC2LF29_PERAE|nr:hypothetical protein MRB53_025035 [Persea americana]